MSDDSVEFGGFGPTTPAHPAVKQRARAGQATTKPVKQNQSKSAGSDRDPGPSKRTTGNALGRPSKRRKEEEIVMQSEDEASGVEEPEVEEVEESVLTGDAVVASSDEDEIQAEVERQMNGKMKNRPNGRTQRTRTKLPPSSSQQQRQPSRSSKVLEVHASDEEDNREDDVIHIDAPPIQTKNVKGERTNAPGGAGGKKGKAPVKRSNQRGATELGEVLDGQDGVVALIDKIGRPGSMTTNAGSTSKDAELTRLREKIIRLEKENKTLSDQLEELFRVRETEAEALVQRSEEQYEAKVRAAEEVNKALTEQLTKKQPLAGIGKSSILHLITREVAEEERQTLDKEVVRLKSELEDAMKKLSVKDQQIVALRQTEEGLKVELKAEIERATALTKQTPRNPQPTPRSGHIAEDPKHREAVKLYEDLTNIIILNIRSIPGSMKKKDEWQFTCCYTHTNESDSVNATTQSLSFSLRSYEDMTDEKPTDWIQYAPLSLDREPSTFVEKLGFLNAAFQFERNQLALFLRTLYTTFEDIVKAAGDSGSDEDMAEE